MKFGVFAIATAAAHRGCEIAGNWYTVRYKQELTCEKIANRVCQYTAGGIIRTVNVDADGVVHTHSYDANVDTNGTFDSTCNTITWDTPAVPSHPGDAVWKRFASDDSTEGKQAKSDYDSGCPTCPHTTTTTTCAPATTTAPPTTTTTTTTTTAPPSLPTSELFEAYVSRVHDTCTGTADKSCHDGTVKQLGHKIGYVLQKPIDGFTKELFYAYSSRMTDTCTGTSGSACHDGSVNQMGGSIGFILTNPIPSKTSPLYEAYSSRIKDTCTGLPDSACHDGSVKAMGHLLGHMPITASITLQDIQGSGAAAIAV